MRRPSLAFLRRRNAERHPGRHNPTFADLSHSRGLRSSCNKDAASLLMSAIGLVTRHARRLFYQFAEQPGPIAKGDALRTTIWASTGARRTDLTISQCCSISLSVFPGSATIAATQSPIIPAGMIAGVSSPGLSLFVSVMKRRLRSQNAGVLAVGGGDAIGIATVI